MIQFSTIQNRVIDRLSAGRYRKTSLSVYISRSTSTRPLLSIYLLTGVFLHTIKLYCKGLYVFIYLLLLLFIHSHRYMTKDHFKKCLLRLSIRFWPGQFPRIGFNSSTLHVIHPDALIAFFLQKRSSVEVVARAASTASAPSVLTRDSLLDERAVFINASLNLRCRACTSSIRRNRRLYGRPTSCDFSPTPCGAFRSVPGALWAFILSRNHAVSFSRLRLAR